MTEWAVVVLAFLLIAWAVTSGWLARHNVTGPLLFTVAGYVIANPDWGPLSVDVETTTVHTLAEITLALVLFADASRVNVAELRRDVGLPVRLLAIGLPLAVVLGALAAAALIPDLGWALAVFVGAALAPTDAALSAPVIIDERIPLRLRRALNVESGLNDGIATPIVTGMLVVAATQMGLESEVGSNPLWELGGGLVVGVGLGAGIALAIRWASAYRWMMPGTRRLATLALAVLAFVLAVSLDLNGFVAAFAAGITSGALRPAPSPEAVEDIDELPELGGQLLGLVVWFLFGAALLPVAFAHLDIAIALYAVASLTLLRLVPVGLAMTRSGLDRPSTIFLGWFGPRGLASVVFALLALEQLGESNASVMRAVAVVSLTIFASVILHGVTAGPGGRRYVRLEASAPGTDEGPAPRAHRGIHRP